MQASSTQPVLEGLATEFAALRSELQSLKASIESNGQDRSMDEDAQDEDVESEDLPDTLWSTVLGTSTVEALKPAASALSSLLSAPPPLWSKCEGRGRE